MFVVCYSKFEIVLIQSFSKTSFEGVITMSESLEPLNRPFVYYEIFKIFDLGYFQFYPFQV